MTSQTLDVASLVNGAMIAMCNSGELLTDAGELLAGRRHSSCVVLSAFAREELGRTEIILEAIRETQAGAIISAAALRRRCADHVTKLRKGQTGAILTLRGERLALMQAMVRGDEVNLASPEGADLLAWLDEAMKARLRHDPQATHNERLASLYVEPNDSGEWNVPMELTRDDAVRAYSPTFIDYSAAAANYWNRPELAQFNAKDYRSLPQPMNRGDF